MQQLHVKIDFNEALEYKKQILETEINFLNVSKNIEGFRLLRREELRKKTALRTRMKSLILKAVLLEKELPKFDMPKIKKHEDFSRIEPRRKQRVLEEELKEIKRKLERLNSV